MSRKLVKHLKAAAGNPRLRPSAREKLDGARAKLADYRRIQPGEPMYDYVQANKRAGIECCDSADHNPGPCSNPECWKH